MREGSVAGAVTACDGFDEESNIAIGDLRSVEEDHW
jgi:hypothetical protein